MQHADDNDLHILPPLNAVNDRRNFPLPEGISRSHVELALAELDEQGMPFGYKQSHTYDLVHNGRLYPPPAVVALAAKALTGAMPEPGFRAGKGTQCFRILEDAGFKLKRKRNDGCVLPSRSSKYSVGKTIGGAVYLHRLYESLLPDIAKRCKRHIGGFSYTVVKFAEVTKTVSFIESPDFDSAHEPEIGDIATVSFNGSLKWRKRLADPYVYHHKWLFVRDDYSGFDVEKSKERSRLWLSLPGIDKNRIGRKRYWDTHVAPLLHDIPK